MNCDHTYPVTQCDCGFKQCPECWDQDANVQCPNCKNPFLTTIVEIGSYRTKCGNINAKLPESFLTVVSKSCATRHSGAFIGMQEYVGESALTCGYPLQFNIFGGSSLAHIENYAQQLSLPNAQHISKSTISASMVRGRGGRGVSPVGRGVSAIGRGALRGTRGSPPESRGNPRGRGSHLNMKCGPRYRIRNVPRSDEITAQQIVVRIGDGLVIDLGHTSTRLFVVTNNCILEEIEYELGGKVVGNFLEKLMSENVRNVDMKHLRYLKDVNIIVNLIKDAQCELPENIDEKMKESGYQNWKYNLDFLCKDNDNFFSWLPSDIVTIVHKILEHEDTTLGRMGWFSVSQPIKDVGQVLSFPYEIGVEKYFAMECLFTPSLIGKREGLLDAIKGCYNKHKELPKTIILCGGMAPCKGLVNRIKRESYFESFEIMSDEHFMWKNACDIVLERNAQ